jgi:hypothetical protein
VCVCVYVLAAVIVLFSLSNIKIKRTTLGASRRESQTAEIYPFVT